MNTGLFIFDTKARELKEISARNGFEVQIYCCGPTVYRDAHVGNLRTFLLGDLIKRTLDFSGIASNLIQNITDVGHMAEDLAGNEIGEDKMLAQSKSEATDPFDIARKYEANFHNDLAQLSVIPAAAYPKASETIDLMLNLISKLIATNHAYVGSDGCVYFSAESFPSYGDISGNRLESLKPGHRHEHIEDGAKKFHADWALWKAANNRTEMIWDSPWGAGFPGWHIECSAMSLHFLEGNVDLHLGGIDLRFPHHENERAQSNAAAGYEVVENWVHGEHLLFEGRKMSKSAGNVVLLSDVIAKGLDPLALRLCFLENRYRSQMDLTWDSLKAAGSTIERWRVKYAHWKSEGEIDKQFVAEFSQGALADIQRDLDTPRAIQQLRKLEKDEFLSGATKAECFQIMDSIFALDITRAPKVKAEPNEEILELLELRSGARASKDFALSDKLRDQLSKLGVGVKDSPAGQDWDWL
ncbi:MAG: cysteine--tRNA ligase [Actinobacteria bacterium]|uniref:Cysteine--tRNA ligase n=2 Tax=freshwater metagenome TaxID=449393 RepID=A0A6J7L7J8_9ZZZZ|nr:cysteine--tRNA ligase [Actinomycetota bacterium]MSW22494.1 cysteine--tRNA ligase [Actinomycetota bacterium]MSX03967.1 cysteine--tRNA ligase [Actinomycetota bacterium]MSX84123.1 cysteine--tRNA ligase [Actinomycetota bacterium]MSY95961.1 cysteine--tRNA ligase [Actinomycetota bacterium]